MFKKRKFLRKRKMIVLMFLLMNIFIYPLASASPRPAFYDDFSDNRFYDRLGADPWGRPWPEWNETWSDSWATVLPLTDFEADNGYLNMHTLGKYYSHITTNFSITASDFFKLEYDYRSLTGASGPGEQMNISIKGPNGGYSYQRLIDGHSWLTMGTNNWTGQLLGWNAPATGPSGVGAYMGNTWHHVEIYRLPTHEMIVFEDGQPLDYDWSDGLKIPVTLGTSDSNQSANWEVWDNPRLYRNYPNGSDFPDTSVTGGFHQIRVGWYNGMVAVDNIKLFTDVNYSDIAVPGTGSISGQVLRDDYPEGDWRAPVTGALVTDGTRVVYTTGNGAGVYSMINVPPGTYTVRAAASGYGTGYSFTNFIPTARTINVVAGQNTVLNLIVTPSAEPSAGRGTLKGTVKDINNNLLTDVTVRAGEMSVITDDEGAFTLPEITEGRFSVLFGKTGLESQTRIVDLVAGTTKVIDVVFTAGSGEDIISLTINANSPTGTGVAVNTPITVTFSETMDKISAESAFSLSPVVSGAFIWSGNQLIFTPAGNLADSVTYTVKISTEAKDLAGNKLAVLYTWSFTTGVLSPDLPEDQDGNKVLVYPNPHVKGKAPSNKITFANLPAGAVIKIYTSSGKLVKELSVDSGDKAEWSIADVSGGIYLYVISSDEGTKRGKVSVIK